MRHLFLYALVIACISISSCNRDKTSSEDATKIDSTILSEMPDTLSAEPEPEPEPLHFTGTNEIVEYIRALPDADAYEDGVIMSAAYNAPKYAEKLLNSKYDKFIVVDKARLMVILYDRYGHVLKEYDCACAKNYGTKHKKADSRTPEGFFSVEGIYNSTDWLFTDDEGNTSKKKGQFGPRFIRLRIPGTSQIGIHGTCAPWSMGHRVSHGCIRILNENILELVELVEPGMPVIVLPGKRDRAVNREEGYEIAYFPTAPKYAMSEAEKKEKIKDRENENEIKNENSDKSQQPNDSVLHIEVENTSNELQDSIF